MHLNHQRSPTSDSPGRPENEWSGTFDKLASHVAS